MSKLSTKIGKKKPFKINKRNRREGLIKMEIDKLESKLLRYLVLIHF